MGAITEGETMCGKAIDVDQELALQMRELDDEERRTFIREAAIAYFASLPYSLDEPTEAETLSQIWKDCAALWDAKPEDC